MIIYPTRIIENENNCRIISTFEVNNQKQELWYDYSKEYKNYLVTENSDAFVVALLFLALKYGENIEVKGVMSSKLNYTLNNYLIPVLILANPKWNKIEIKGNKLNEENLNEGNSSGTGISCGVDSFATFFNHQNLNGSLKIEYLTYFNVGSHGDFGGRNSRMIFNERFSKVERFSKEVNLPIIKVDSNLSDILKMNFQNTSTLRSISCILNLQKLFKYYYYASSHKLGHFEVNNEDISYFDFLTLSTLGTESLTFFSSEAKYDRIEKTLFITKFKETFKYLDVCTNPLENKAFNNCSKCEKCMRTQLTLDLLGKLELYSEVFDLTIYSKQKDNFIGKLIALKNKKGFNSDLYIFLKKMNFQFLLKHFLISYSLKRKIKVNKLKKYIKSLVKIN